MDQQTMTTVENQPPNSTTTKPDTIFTIPSTAEAGVRVTTIFVLITLSLWANLEASKLFDIKIINGAKHTLVGKQFQLNFVSNGYAERLILRSSHAIEHILYPMNQHPKKPVHKVTLYFSAHNFTSSVSVSTPSYNSGEFIITLSPSVMSMLSEAERAIASALQLGMAHVWLWDGNGKAPPTLLNAMAEFLRLSSAPKWEHKDLSIKNNSTCWNDSNYLGVAQFLKYCNEHQSGFVARLNSAMQEDFYEGMVDIALGVPARRLCSDYLSSAKIEEVVNLSAGSVNYM